VSENTKERPYLRIGRIVAIDVSLQLTLAKLRVRARARARDKTYNETCKGANLDRSFADLETWSRRDRQRTVSLRVSLGSLGKRGEVDLYSATAHYPVPARAGGQAVYARPAEPGSRVLAAGNSRCCFLQSREAARNH